MNIDFKKLIISIGIPSLIGWLSSHLSGNIRGDYLSLNQPPLAPPSWVFGTVWAILFTMMGIAFYLVITSDAPRNQKENAMRIYFVQLAFNFFWPLIFFGTELYAVAFVWLVILLILIALTIRAFGKISKPAAYLLIPYFLWVVFAGYLNLGIWYLN